jgi:hypothetical protein
MRQGIASLPLRARLAVSEVMAATLYGPLARAARSLERLGIDAANLPLNHYRDQSFYVMRNDALDKFGTRIEHRFSRAENTEHDGAGRPRAHRVP